MATVNSIKELERLVNQKINNALKNDVAESIKDIMQQKVQSEVYDAYTSNSDHPDAYVRRGEQGGLKDRRNMKSEVTNNTLTVENTARMTDTGYELAGLIEYGHDNGYGEYDYSRAKNSKGDFRQPRPFIEESRNEIEKTNVHVEAMKKGLRKQGLDIE